MALANEVKTATDNDDIAWTHKVVEGESLYYSEFPNGELVYIPSTNVIKIRGYSGALDSTIQDLSTEIQANVDRLTQRAVSLRDE